MPSPNPPASSYIGYGVPSPFPPSFEGNPLSYAWGLFGDTVAAALALTLLLGYVFEGRRKRQVNKALDNYVVEPPVAQWSPLWLYRHGQLGFFTFVVMRTLPDALWMLMWGEVHTPTIKFLLMLDMVADGFSIFPLLYATMMWAYGRQVIPQKLAEGVAIAVSGKAPWDVILKNLRIVAVVIVISLLVTIGKASG